MREIIRRKPFVCACGQTAIRKKNGYPECDRCLSLENDRPKTYALGQRPTAEWKCGGVVGNKDWNNVVWDFEPILIPDALARLESMLAAGIQELTTSIERV